MSTTRLTTVEQILIEWRQSLNLYRSLTVSRNCKHNAVAEILGRALKPADALIVQTMICDYSQSSFFFLNFVSISLVVENVRNCRNLRRNIFSFFAYDTQRVFGSCVIQLHDIAFVSTKSIYLVKYFVWKHLTKMFRKKIYAYILASVCLIEALSNLLKIKENIVGEDFNPLVSKNDSMNNYWMKYYYLKERREEI